MRATYNGALSVEEPRIDFEQVAGHEEVKEYFIELGEILQSGEGLEDLPRGLIFAGPPGTGKTMLAEAVAKQLGVNFIKLNIQNQLDMFVGNSQKNLARALRLIETMTPVVVFIDELDTQFESRDNGPSGSSVGGSLLGMFLEFMSEPSHIGKVIIIGATNRPDLIDAALLRPGRFDTLIPLLPGSAESRARLLEIAAVGRGKQWANGITLDAFLQNSDGWTQAELTKLFTGVCEEARRSGHPDTLTQDDLNTAVRFIRPSTRQVQQWSMIAVQMCNDWRLLPPVWRDLAEQNRAEPETPVVSQPLEAEPRTRGRRNSR
jgi:transitional endoplasmic reticulum ATPase